MFLLPTLNRTHKLKTFLKSVIDTNNQVEGLILVDQKDFSLNNEAYIDIENNHLPAKWKLVVTRSVSMGAKCREIIPTLDPITKYIGLLNDDHFCKSEKCLEVLVSKLDGKNFVSANDGTVNAFRLPVTATAWSVGLLRAINWAIYPPFLEHLFIDNLWLELGKATGCWKMVASAMVEHHHVLFGKAEEDETHKKVYGADFKTGKPGEMWAKDQANFNSFMQSDFHLAVAKIKQFQDWLPGEAWNPQINRLKTGLVEKTISER